MNRIPRLTTSLSCLFCAFALTPAMVACEGEGTSEDTPTEEETLAWAEIVAAGGWAADMGLVIDGDSIVITDDGIPDHVLLEGYAIPGGGVTSVVESAYGQTITLNPVLADEPTDTALGAIGVAISGGLIFNPFEGDGESVALDSNFVVDGVPFVDACNGHPVPSGTQYHYHGVPYCITDRIDTVGAHSAMVGLMLDGFPVYGARGIDGNAPTDLDECSGHTGPTPEFPDNTYHYHLREVAPYSIVCLRGEVTLGGGGGPGGPGGPGPGGP